MPPWTSIEARNRPFLPVMRELVRTYQAFERFDAALHRENQLTTSQADVIFTLGNTKGLTCKELGKKTLITKGTLTGILDRLEKKSLIRRRRSNEDGRSLIVALTKRGEALFEAVFPAHIQRLEAPLADLDERSLQALKRQLRSVRQRLEAAGADPPS